MRPGGSFARDWQLIKLARTRAPHDISQAIVEHLLEANNPLVVKEIGKAARALGQEEGRQFRERMPGGMDGVSVLESLFLVGGIWCEVARDGDAAHLRIRKDTGTFLGGNNRSEAIALPFLSGIIEAILPGATIRDSGDLLDVDVPAPGR
jgi:hypothetical protein